MDYRTVIESTLVELGIPVSEKLVQGIRNRLDNVNKVIGAVNGSKNLRYLHSTQIIGKVIYDYLQEQDGTFFI